MQLIKNREKKNILVLFLGLCTRCYMTQFAFLELLVVLTFAPRDLRVKTTLGTAAERISFMGIKLTSGCYRDHNFRRAGQIWCSPFDCSVAFESPHYLPLHFARSAHSCEGQRIDNMKFLLVIEHRQNCTIKNLLLRMWTMKKYQFQNDWHFLV